MTRPATPADVSAIADVINEAYLVEAFFVSGPRVDDEAVRGLMQTGRFLIASGADGGIDACVYIEPRGAAGYLGLLSVRSAAQGRGLGAAMLDAAERALAETCDRVVIHVVNLRTELDPFYRRRGYVRTGTLPFGDVQRLIPPHTDVHFVVMEKGLTPPPAAPAARTPETPAPAPDPDRRT